MSSTDNLCKVLPKSMYVLRDLGTRGQAALPPIPGVTLRVSIVLKLYRYFSKLSIPQTRNTGRPLDHPPLWALQPVLSHPDRRQTSPSARLSNRRPRSRHHLPSRLSPLLRSSERLRTRWITHPHQQIQSPQLILYLNCLTSHAMGHDGTIPTLFNQSLASPLLSVCLAEHGQNRQ